MSSMRSSDNEDDAESEHPRASPNELLRIAFIGAAAVGFVVQAVLAPPKASRTEPDVRMIDASPNNVTARYFVPQSGNGARATWSDLQRTYQLSQSEIDALMIAFDRRREARTPTVLSDPLPQGETVEIPLE